MDNNSVKRNIEGIRKELGLSQQTMAEKLGITRNAYRRIEKGQTRLFNDVIPKLADLSGRTVEEIFIGFRPYASYDVALQDEHTRFSSQVETLRNDYDARIQVLETENRHLQKVLGMAEDEITLLRSMVAMLQKNQNQ